MNKIFVIFMVNILFLSGCTTLSKSECQQSNWGMIGFGEDERGKDFQSDVPRARQTIQNMEEDIERGLSRIR